MAMSFVTFPMKRIGAQNANVAEIDMSVGQKRSNNSVRERRVRGGGVLMSVMKGVTEKLNMEFQNLLIEVSFQNRDFLLIKELSQ